MYDPNAYVQNSNNMQFQSFAYNDQDLKSHDFNSQPQQTYSNYQPQQQGGFFTPSAAPSGKGFGGDEEDYENEPPLLEELGINFGHIIERTQVVLNPFHEVTKEVLNDTDLAGPLVFCLLFGSTLLLAGKLHFNYIYGLGVFGSVFMYLLLTMMSPDGCSITCVISVLGYCMLPMCALSSVGVLWALNGLVGGILTAVVIMWCSLASSKLFVRALDMQHQRFLVAYPCALVYSAFALLTIF